MLHGCFLYRKIAIANLIEIAWKFDLAEKTLLVNIPRILAFFFYATP